MKRTNLSFEKLISELFSKIQSCWGNKWTNIFENDPELLLTGLKEWISALKDLTDNEIWLAYEKAKYTMAWPPSIAEFRLLAKDIPKPFKAYTMCKTGNYKNNEIVNLVYNSIGSYNFKTMPEQELKRLFFEAYDTAISEILIPEEKNVF